jgi:hypothetical protein
MRRGRAPFARSALSHERGSVETGGISNAGSAGFRCQGRQHHNGLTVPYGLRKRTRIDWRQEVRDIHRLRRPRIAEEIACIRRRRLLSQLDRLQFLAAASARRSRGHAGRGITHLVFAVDQDRFRMHHDQELRGLRLRGQQGGQPSRHMM